MVKNLEIRREKGTVLIVSLIILLLLTLVGTTGTQVTGLEEKMASNMRDRNLAFQAAESALQFAEASLCPSSANCPDAALSFTDAGTGGYYSLASTIPTNTALMTDAFWTTNPVVAYDASALGNNIHDRGDPQYVIQQLNNSCAVVEATCQPLNIRYNFRITARATGGTTSAVVLLQSNYQVP
jgi:type IV pilus assembly protein PilX